MGPAKTTVAEVARRAGVTRLTVYNNFPEERELFAACQGHWMELHPLAALDPAEGAGGGAALPVRVVPRDRAAWRRTSGATAPAVPALDALMRDTADARMSALGKALGGGPLIALALDFWTWRRLAAEGLDDDEAAAADGTCHRARLALREFA